MRYPYRPHGTGLKVKGLLQVGENITPEPGLVKERNYPHGFVQKSWTNQDVGVSRPKISNLRRETAFINLEQVVV